MIFDKLVTIMAEQLGVQPQEISTDTLLRDDLAVDSLDLYNLIMVLEEEFNIELPQEELNDIETVEDIIKILKEQGVEE
ncbi:MULTISPECIES: acyl carrier protein [Eubacterium]|jgi:acyl carrier protein|uniref:Acyl carrier protein n=1 Tax=Eubacterium ruminantium TaxID=42322 RepID=A0A1T4L2Q6_9FIRM|nr:MULTISPECIES: acyl carrier protein [Eubacterium]SCW42828.1 acyl carrier protein [Eubacterium ruminantium]SDM82080.1 acyl carrier protein [Eubacterium ruminantium]SJZ48800.1 acyl carrier protein [Eubacterium ruminantium]